MSLLEQKYRKNREKLAQRFSLLIKSHFVKRWARRNKEENVKTEALPVKRVNIFRRVVNWIKGKLK